MNGYLIFLRSLSEYQQRAEIGRLAFTERWNGSSLQEDLLKLQAVATVSETLGVNPPSWEFDLKHYAEEPDLIGTPVFRTDQCTAPFSFRYEYLSHSLVITGTIRIEDDESAMIGPVTCHTCLFNQEKSRSRLVLAGINPDTLKTVSHNVEMSRDIPFLDYIKAVLPQQRRDAIFDLAELVWGSDNPKFLDYPKLAPELQRLGISELQEADRCHEVGPVEFEGGRCTAPLMYSLFGEGELSKYDEHGLGYFVEVHILACIGNNPSGGGEISIENMWFRIESIDDPEDNAIPLLVP
jgi:hypothetical protein